MESNKRLRSTLSLTVLSVFFSFFLTSCQSNDTDKTTKAEPTEATQAETKSEAPVAKTEAATANPTVTTEATPTAVETQKTPAVSPNFVEGQHYTTIFPEIALDVPAGKVSIIEMFWYGCPHCHDLEPALNKWLSNMPANVEFSRLPATLNPNWEFHAKAYYATQMLDPNNAMQLHEKIFMSLHKQKRRLQTEDALKRFFVSQGVDAAKFDAAFKSMEMNLKLEQARKLSTASQSHSVPAIIINGKYRSSASMAGSEERLFELVNYLVAKEAKAQQ